MKKQRSAAEGKANEELLHGGIFNVFYAEMQIRWLFSLYIQK